jgi:hypothetical protein
MKHEIHAGKVKKSSEEHHPPRMAITTKLTTTKTWQPQHFFYKGGKSIHLQTTKEGDGN